MNYPANRSRPPPGYGMGQMDPTHPQVIHGRLVHLETWSAQVDRDMDRLTAQQIRDRQHIDTRTDANSRKMSDLKSDFIREKQAIMIWIITSLIGAVVALGLVILKIYFPDVPTPKG